MRIDAHQHFWQYSPEEYGWISEAMPAIRRSFGPDDLKPLLDAADFQASVAVQARQSLEETRWLLHLADAHAHVAGVVGWVELCSPDVLGQIEDFAHNPKFVGVRHVLQDEPDDEFMLREDFRAGLGLLNGYGLAYDLLLHPRHLPIAAKLVARFPEQRFVLDHLAKPFIADGKISPWREDLQALAAFPNVYCKLSGMVTEAKWGAWAEADFAPYLDAALEAFGADRLMIGSDWPVCLLSGDYAATMGIVMQYIEKLSGAEQAAILGGNCARFYRLKAAS
ncbi:MAG TPA: amidohydrolase family protein [Acidobacteriaceae bacterium]|nr:amidohydrolase family protein [Acidobacteriaceae bacterium]